MLSARERVDLGTALLDEVVGPTWFEEVNPDTLDISSGCRCVAAQVVHGFEGGYNNAWEYAMHEWGIVAPEPGTIDASLITTDNEKAKRLGFLGHDMAEDIELQEAWCDVIAERVAARAS